jgi:hypothetical protein
VNPGEIGEFQLRPDLPPERVRVLVPLGSLPGDVLAVFLRLSDYKRLIWYRDGRVVEAVS